MVINPAPRFLSCYPGKTETRWPQIAGLSPLVFVLSPPIYSSIASTAAKSSTQLAVLVGEVEDSLGQVGGLNNAANLDSTFVFDEFTN